MGEADENAAASHTGHILCMNVAGGDNDPKQNQAHEAIVAAYKQAVTSNARPGIILLQVGYLTAIIREISLHCP